MTTRPNYWYDAEVTVRVYLPGRPEESDIDGVELEIQGAIDSAHEAVTIRKLADGREIAMPLMNTGVMLSCHGVELGEVQGYDEEVGE